MILRIFVFLRVLVCFFATFLSNGVARFGYVVLIPIMILSAKLTQSQSVELALAVLVGYIFGSLFISFLKKFFTLEGIAKLSFLLIALSFFACALDSLPFIWLWFWRFVAGFASSALIILSAPLSMPYVDEKWRQSVGGLVFSGVGIGALFSGLVLPFLAEFNLDFVWIACGLFAFLLFLLSLFGLKTFTQEQNHNEEKLKLNLFLILLMISYALNAIAYLPHTIFWADYMARELEFGTFVAGNSWAFFGIGAAFGSLISGVLAQKFGAKIVHFWVLILKSFSCFLAVLTKDIFWLNFSVFLMGFGTIANVVLTNAMTLELVGKLNFWINVSFLTFIFGLFQALFSYAFSYLSLYLGSYVFIFYLSGILLLLSAFLLLPIKKS